MQQKLSRYLLLAVVLTCTAGPLRAAGNATGPSSDVETTFGPNGFLSSWLCLGPLDESAANAVFRGGDTTVSAPSAGLLTAGKRWTLSHFKTSDMRFPAKQNRALILYARLVSPDSRRIWMSTGSNGPIRARLGDTEILTRTVSKRKALTDTDLSALDLAPGDNDLWMIIHNPETRGLAASVRFMNNHYEPETEVYARFPGTAQKLPEAIEQTGHLQLRRIVDLSKASVRVRARLLFPGGRPISDTQAASVSFHYDDSALDESLSTPDADNGSATIPLGESVWSTEPLPKRVSVSFGEARFSHALGFRLHDVRRLAQAAADLTAALKRFPVEQTTRESLEWRITHLTTLIENGDEDYLYLDREIRNTERMAEALAEGNDPYYNRRNELQRRGYRSSIDGSLQPYVLYVPFGWKEEDTRQFPLIVSLHGLSSGPMKAMQAVFGIPKAEEETREMMERHPKPVPGATMFVLTPYGFGNSGYRAFGEADVLAAIAAVEKRYRIDPNRIYITGASMGGIGAAALPFHYPDRFAASAPLCGYHSMFLYRGVVRKPLLPFERFIAESRSNAYWAANGRYLPMYIVHGLKDRPAQSRVLVNRYRQLKYDIKFETPDLGHNVWEPTYQGRKIFAHFAPIRRVADPRNVLFRTGSLRYFGAHFVRIEALKKYDRWAEVSAERSESNRLTVTADNVAQITLLNDPALRGEGPVTATINGSTVVLSEEKPEWTLTAKGDTWQEQTEPPPRDRPVKRHGLSGPIDDAYFEPLLFVYGTENPAEKALSRRLITAMISRKASGHVHWPVKADVDVTEADILSKSLVIVGTPTGNRLLEALTPKLPIRATPEGIFVGERRFDGRSTAAAFIYPNPLNPTRYLTVYTAASLEALFYVGHLPETVPDWIVFDAPAMTYKYGRIFDTRPVRAAGYFNGEWKLEGGDAQAPTGMSSR